jgi:sortase A
MTVVVKREPLRGTLRWAQRLLFSIAAVLLGYYGFVKLDAWVFEQRESRALQRLLDNNGHPGVLQFRSATTTPRSVSTATGGLIGRIEVRRLGLSVMVMEGTGSKTLRRAAGHIPGTALPGERGNVGISAHRDSFFRPLRNIQENDIITLTTVLGEYMYRVVSTKIVSPNNVAVLAPNGSEVLTLVTCYPFYFVGTAPDRFIVRAERVS